MWISQVELNNFKSFADARFELSKGINLIIGQNNSGKSALLKSVAWLQQGSSISPSDLRLSKNKGLVQITLGDSHVFFSKLKKDLGNTVTIRASLIKTPPLRLVRVELFQYIPKTEIHTNQKPFWEPDESAQYSYDIPNCEPKNFIYPYLSKRKVLSYDESINLTATQAVSGNFSNLYAKVDRLSNPEILSHSKYIEVCRNILGFVVTTTHSEGGKKAAYIVDDEHHISLEEMGEGVPNLLGLIVDLCTAKGKLFLIEEPENDIHPEALKKLLSLISEKSQENQFIITTHSNIVVRHLGANENSKLFRVTMEFDENKIPISKVEEIENSSSARLQVLEELGYEFIDFDIWAAWLFLEEASAEKIIRDFLIPLFTPKLKNILRTFSASSLSQVKKKFRTFNDLFVFIHLQPQYKNLAWVVIDGGEEEEKVIKELKECYGRHGWNPDHFQQFSKHDFERYYPTEFDSTVDSVLNEKDSNKRQEGKRNLLKEVEIWLKEDAERAKKALEESASEVIKILKEIESKVT